MGWVGAPGACRPILVSGAWPATGGLPDRVRAGQRPGSPRTREPAAGSCNSRTFDAYPRSPAGRSRRTQFVQRRDSTSAPACRARPVCARQSSAGTTLFLTVTIEDVTGLVAWLMGALAPDQAGQCSRRASPRNGTTMPMRGVAESSCVVPAPPSAARHRDTGRLNDWGCGPAGGCFFASAGGRRGDDPRTPNKGPMMRFN